MDKTTIRDCPICFDKQKLAVIQIGTLFLYFSRPSSVGGGISGNSQRWLLCSWYVSALCQRIIEMMWRCPRAPLDQNQGDTNPPTLTEPLKTFLCTDLFILGYTEVRPRPWHCWLVGICRDWESMVQVLSQLTSCHLASTPFDWLMRAWCLFYTSISWSRNRGCIAIGYWQLLYS